MSENKSSSGSSATGLFLGVASLAAGAYHGYMDGQGVSIKKENLEWALIYGPTLVQGGLGATFGGIAGLIGGGVIGAKSSGWRDSALEKVAKGTGGAVIGTAAGAGLGGVVGGIKGGLQTLIGYGIGYVVGSMMK